MNSNQNKTNQHEQQNNVQAHSAKSDQTNHQGMDRSSQQSQNNSRTNQHEQNSQGRASATNSARQENLRNTRNER